MSARGEDGWKAISDMEDQVYGATEMAHRWLDLYGKDYTNVHIEEELQVGDVVGHPDLIGWRAGDFDERWEVVDFKTSARDDSDIIPAYDASGQADLYAWLWSEQFGSPDHEPRIGAANISIAYHILAENIYPYSRMADLDKGSFIFDQIKWLGKTTESSIEQSKGPDGTTVPFPLWDMAADWRPPDPYNRYRPGRAYEPAEEIFHDGGWDDQDGPRRRWINRNDGLRSAHVLSRTFKSNSCRALTGALSPRPPNARQATVIR